MFQVYGHRYGSLSSIGFHPRCYHRITAAPQIALRYRMSARNPLINKDPSRAFPLFGKGKVKHRLNLLLGDIKPVGELLHRHSVAVSFGNGIRLHR